MLFKIPYKTCRLLIILGPFSAKGPQKYQKSIRFFTKSWWRSTTSQNITNPLVKQRFGASNKVVQNTLQPPELCPEGLKTFRQGILQGTWKGLKTLVKTRFGATGIQFRGGRKYKKPIKTVSKTRFWATWRILWIQFQGGGNIKTPVNTEENYKFGGERCHPEIQFQGGKYKK